MHFRGESTQVSPFSKAPGETTPGLQQAGTSQMTEKAEKQAEGQLVADGQGLEWERPGQGDILEYMGSKDPSGSQEPTTYSRESNEFLPISGSLSLSLQTSNYISRSPSQLAGGIT